MREVILQKSSNPKKKYDAYIEGKKVSFGATGYSDFTQHKDEERKQRYIARHKVNQNWNDLTTAGAWSKGILWNKPTITDSIKSMEGKFNIDIKYKKIIIPLLYHVSLMVLDNLIVCNNFVQVFLIYLQRCTLLLKSEKSFLFP